MGRDGYDTEKEIAKDQMSLINWLIYILIIFSYAALKGRRQEGGDKTLGLKYLKIKLFANFQNWALSAMTNFYPHYIFLCSRV